MVASKEHICSFSFALVTIVVCKIVGRDPPTCVFKLLSYLFDTFAFLAPFGAYFFELLTTFSIYLPSRFFEISAPIFSTILEPVKETGLELFIIGVPPTCY
jgi:hypothetical protein